MHNAAGNPTRAVIEFIVRVDTRQPHAKLIRGGALFMVFIGCCRHIAGGEFESTP